MPDKKNRGEKATMIIKVAFRMEALISVEPSKTTLVTGSRCSLGRRRFLRSFLYTFSTSMMASSTNDPIAMHMPPKVIVLMFCPNRYSTITVPKRESGIATTEIKVVRKLPKKTKRMMMTKIAPSTRLRPTLLTEASMKSDWRKISVSKTTSGGRLPLSDSKVARISSVTSKVLTLGCLEIVIRIEGCALVLA